MGGGARQPAERNRWAGECSRGSGMEDGEDGKGGGVDGGGVSEGDEEEIGVAVAAEWCW